MALENRQSRQHHKGINMIHTGICPSCKKTVRNVKVEDIEIRVGFQAQWRGLSYQCTSCKCVLGVQMDPLALNENLKEEILREIKKL